MRVVSSLDEINITIAIFRPNSPVINQPSLIASAFSIGLAKITEHDVWFFNGDLPGFPWRERLAFNADDLHLNVFYRRADAILTM